MRKLEPYYFLFLSHAAAYLLGFSDVFVDSHGKQDSVYQQLATILVGTYLAYRAVKVFRSMDNNFYNSYNFFLYYFSISILYLLLY